MVVSCVLHRRDTSSAHQSFGNNGNYIKERIASGLYDDADQVISDAIRRMRDEDRRIAAFRAAVAVGQADIDSGKSRAFTPEVGQEIIEAALKGMDKGQPVDPDALP